MDPTLWLLPLLTTLLLLGLLPISLGAILNSPSFAGRDCTCGTCALFMELELSL